eukprot:GFKZ01008783.1.p2 GENE.GFKZ01008783.1~~GFKZ01008783.1.p2  ORF type:complete len:125 (+),score=5.14 GFKZ01008783.1:425-799(+)
MFEPPGPGPQLEHPAKHVGHAVDPRRGNLVSPQKISTTNFSKLHPGPYFACIRIRVERPLLSLHPSLDARDHVACSTCYAPHPAPPHLLCPKMIKFQIFVITPIHVSCALIQTTARRPLHICQQ